MNQERSSQSKTHEINHLKQINSEIKDKIQELKQVGDELRTRLRSKENDYSQLSANYQKILQELKNLKETRGEIKSGMRARLDCLSSFRKMRQEMKNLSDNRIMLLKDLKDYIRQDNSLRKNTGKFDLDYLSVFKGLINIEEQNKTLLDQIRQVLLNTLDSNDDDGELMVYRNQTNPIMRTKANNVLKLRNIDFFEKLNF